MNPIGFNPFGRRTNKDSEKRPELKVKGEIKPTIVQIFFPDRNRTLSYYNDRFDLHMGDIVFVDGKLEGLRGRVTAVSTSGWSDWQIPMWLGSFTSQIPTLLPLTHRYCLGNSFVPG